MEFKRRRMIKSEIDRLLSDEGTRNLLSGIKVIQKSKKLTRIVTRNRVPSIKKNANSTRGIIIDSGASPISSSVTGTNRVKDARNSNEKTKKIIKKSLSLLHSNKINNGKITTSTNSSTSVSGKITNGGKMNGGATKLSNGVRANSAGAGHTTTTTTSSTKGGSPATGNGVTSSKVSSSTPSLPLLASLVRGNVAFITLSYQNHSCVLRTQDLRDLVRKLEEYESRRGISVIVMNSSSDRFFCDGLDYKELIHADLNKRKNAVQLRINCIKNVLNTLAKSKKLLIASVNGGKVNSFGLVLLGLFDLVYANDKATFSLQKYFTLKQPPEGISVFSQMQLQTPTMKSFLYMGKVCTASEMYQNGFLVTEVLWDGSRYHEQLASKLQNVNANEHTKSIYKTYSSKNTKQLGNDLAHEFSILECTWVSDSWQKCVLQQLHRDRHNN